MSAQPPDGTLQVDVTSADRRDWMVTLDDTWTLQSDEKGRVVFQNVPPGPTKCASARRRVLRNPRSPAPLQPAATISFDATR
jgi:hypothetical protein